MKRVVTLLIALMLIAIPVSVSAENFTTETGTKTCESGTLSKGAKEYYKTSKDIPKSRKTIGSTSFKAGGKKYTVNVIRTANAGKETHYKDVRKAKGKDFWYIDKEDIATMKNDIFIDFPTVKGYTKKVTATYKSNSTTKKTTTNYKGSYISGTLQKDTFNIAKPSFAVTAKGKTITVKVTVPCSRTRTKTEINGEKKKAYTTTTTDSTQRIYTAKYTKG